MLHFLLFIDKLWLILDRHLHLTNLQCHLGLYSKLLFSTNLVCSFFCFAIIIHHSFRLWWATLRILCFMLRLHHSPSKNTHIIVMCRYQYFSFVVFMSINFYCCLCRFDCRSHLFISFSSQCHQRLSTHCHHLFVYFST